MTVKIYHFALNEKVCRVYRIALSFNFLFCIYVYILF